MSSAENIDGIDPADITPALAVDALTQSIVSAKPADRVELVNDIMTDLDRSVSAMTDKEEKRGRADLTAEDIRHIVSHGNRAQRDRLKRKLSQSIAAAANSEL